MVLWIILTIGLTTLVQCIDTLPTKHRFILYAPGNISLTFYKDFNNVDKEFKVSLSRGMNKSVTFCVGSFNYTQIPFEENNCRVTPAVDNVTFFLWDLTANHTDIYFFHKEVMYPPPYNHECDEGTFIHVKEPACPKHETTIIQTTSLSPLIALGCFALYSLIITMAFLYIVRKGRRTRIQQSEYINVVPRRTRPPLPCVTYSTTDGYSHSR
ncbi:PREDICTED: T-cell-specific surface glycoprotein CD28 [Nanorana parkeri]|uniref:T-cell-specific surface glycoprotein CD28 n=1 Tax=Nanorana parkeri TaxID=125878 RepID=UPI0008549CB6|nr:PREDICTED: T-cell-specific surface glycoprotein CD28 [Nanorana parkeri]